MTTEFSRRQFVVGAGAVAATAAVAGGLPSGSAEAAVPGASVFSALPRAVRVVDTRSPDRYAFHRFADNHIQLALAGRHGIPAEAVAVVATVTAVNRDVANFVTVFPSGTAVPLASNLNLPYPWEINANLVTCKLGSGAIDVFSNTPCHVVVDVTGYYVPVAGPVAAGRYVGLDEAARVGDTRPDYVAAGSIVAADLSAVVPPGATNAVINLTATECLEPGYCTVFPFHETEVPNASSLNWSWPGATRASAVIVPLGPERRIKIFTLSPAKLIVDVTGYFTGEQAEVTTEGTFVPLDPVRILDTREPAQMDPQTPAGVLWPGWVREATIPGQAGTDAASVLLNLTGTRTRGPGYLTVGPARRALPGTSNVNWTEPDTTVPNHAISRITDGAGVQVFTSHGAAIVADLAGYYVGRPAPAQLDAPVNPPPTANEVPWVLRVPGLGLDIGVLGGDSVRTTNSGYAWHWTGTGLLGETSNVGIFAHRTEYGGPFRHLQYLQPGHEWWVDTTDGRRYVYVMTRRDLTDANNANILDAIRFEEAPSCSLIACTVGYDRSKAAYPDRWAPTSTKYRIIVTGRLSHWHALW